MGKTVSIIQPLFLPWKGYFHIIQQSDVFVFLDDVQYVKRSWLNRNIIKTRTGTQWISVPVFSTGKYTQKINQVSICHDELWQKKIISSIRHAYSKAPFFKDYFPLLEFEFLKPWKLLSDLNIHMVKVVGKMLGIDIEYICSSNLNIHPDCKRLQRILEILRLTKAEKYISGPSAKSYIESDKPFRDLGITLAFQEYHYLDYPQLSEPFVAEVSVIDLLFNLGPKSCSYIWNSPELIPSKN